MYTNVHANFGPFDPPPLQPAAAGGAFGPPPPGAFDPPQPPPPPPPPPPPDQTAARATAAGRQNVQNTRWHQDGTYDREQTKFMNWVIKQRRDGTIVEPDDARFCTRNKVDLYYALEVVNRMMNKKSLNRVGYALQKLANREYAGEAVMFTVKEDFVKQQQVVQEERYYQFICSQTSTRDPIADLMTNMLTLDDKYKFVHTVLSTNKINWGCLNKSMTGCEAMICRMKSLAVTRLCDNHLNNTHAPRQEGPYDREMLATAYQPGVHKEKNTHKRVIGVWRHFHWWHCYVTHFGMDLMYKLNSGMQLDFMKPQATRENRNPQPGWWSIKSLT